MVREMRRNKQVLSQEDTKVIMDRCTNGVLACLGDEGYPYAVPLSYVYFNGKIYFHSAKAGNKLDAITNYTKVSFAVIDEDTIVSAEYTSYFRSAIAFGKARIAEGDEGLEAFKAMAQKYSGDLPEDDRHKAVAECTNTTLIAIDIDHITGKEAIELVRAKQQ